MQKQNYQRKMEEILHQLPDGEKPSLLLHSCCGPCSTQVLRVLEPYFTISIYFYNPNVHPKSEYILRLNEQRRLLESLSPELNIGIIEAPYDPETYFQSVKGLEELGEGSERCFSCYALRLRKTANKAKEAGFDYFTTTLSISPYKNAQQLNDLGKRMEEETGVKYLYGDFKKKDGYAKSIRLSEKYNLYRQQYCGCIYSYHEAKEKREEKNDGEN